MRSAVGSLSLATLWALAGCAAQPAPPPMAAPSLASELSPLSRAKATLAIGSFDKARGGIESLQSSDEAVLKAAIRKKYGGTFHFSPRLSSAFLGKINLIVIGVAAGDTTEITPLNAREQEYLLEFVKHGGSAVLFADNPAGRAKELDTFYPGWLNALGYATDLAHFPGSGASAAAYLPAGTIDSGSGPVVAFSDSSLMLDYLRTKDDQIAILNAIGLAQ